MKVKIFSCKFCSDKGIHKSFSRSGLREHLRKEHIRNNLFNKLPKNPDGSTQSHGHAYPQKQEWVIRKEA
jgi:hypothetical protein